MADVQLQIQEKYGIDIKKTNLFKLYKIDNADISLGELEQKFADAKKRWNQGVNGANEKFAKRDAAHLENAEKYEAILKDEKLRKLLYAFYSNSNDAATSIDIAKQYFALLATSKHYNRYKDIENDLELFFQYFSEERKNKKAILAMLEKEYKIKGLAKGENMDIEDDVEGEKKGSDPRIKHRFDKATILKIRKCEEQLQEAAQNEELEKKEPRLKNALYDFLQMDEIESLQEMKAYVAQKREESHNNYQEKGQAYTPLVKLYNSMTDILEYKDVVDNWKPFKLMVKYAKLSPYMYGLDVVKPNTLEQLYQVARQAYLFGDMNEFILVYFSPLYNHFKMQVQPVKKMLDTAKTKTVSNKFFQIVNEKLGVRRGASIPWYVMAVHWLVYFPILATYLVFEVIKTLFENPKRFAILSAIVVAIASYTASPVSDIAAGMGLLGILEAYGEKILEVVILTALAGFFAYELSNVLNLYCEWIGTERTFIAMLEKMFGKTEREYNDLRDGYMGKKIPKIIINLMCVAVLGVLIWAM